MSFMFLLSVKSSYGLFDYVKVGGYKEEYGPLNKETTNQRLYEIGADGIKDITYRFWKKETA